MSKYYHVPYVKSNSVTPYRLIPLDTEKSPSAALHSKRWQSRISEVNDKNVAFPTLCAVADALWYFSGKTAHAHVGISKLSERTHVSVSTVGQALRVLRLSDFLKIRHTQVTRVIDGVSRWVRGVSRYSIKGFASWVKSFIHYRDLKVAATERYKIFISKPRNSPPTGGQPRRSDAPDNVLLPIEVTLNV